MKAFRRKRFVLGPLVIGLWILATGSASAQSVAAPWPECYSRCAHPQDMNPCCSPSWATSTCTRTDSGPFVISPGTLVVIPGEGFEFECPNCCKFEPDECPANDVNPAIRHCVLEPGITFTESIDLSVSGSITVFIGVVEVMLESGVGVTQGSEVHVSLTCPLDTPKCRNSACQPSIKYWANREVRVDHDWEGSGTWITLASCTTGPGCPIAGNRWIVTGCNMDFSTAIGNKLVSASCGNPYAKPCDPRLPCN